MEKYKNVSKKSGVLGYETRETSILIEFVDGSCYLYTYHSAGPGLIDQMKLLAKKGKGLGTFINTSLKGKHELKLR